MSSWWKEQNTDPDFLEHCRDLCRFWRAPCFVCAARDGTVVPHHVHAKRRFGDKANIVFACGTCHREIHDHGYTWFEQKHGVPKEDFEREAARIYSQFTRIWQDDGGLPF